VDLIPQSILPESLISRDALFLMAGLSVLTHFLAALLLETQFPLGIHNAAPESRDHSNHHRFKTEDRSFSIAAVTGKSSKHAVGRVIRLIRLWLFIYERFFPVARTSAKLIRSIVNCTIDTNEALLLEANALLHDDAPHDSTYSLSPSPLQRRWQFH